MTGPAATDDVPGLGRVEQLVLRGDGLTTTSMEILTGVDIGVEVVDHWVLPIHSGAVVPLDRGTGEYTGVVPDHVLDDLDEILDLLSVDGDATLLLREIVHRGSDGRRYGASAVRVLLERLPGPVARTLAQSDEPIGRALRAGGIDHTRDIVRWGLAPAGARASTLAGGVAVDEPLAARTYVMREAAASGSPIGVFTEWFAPALFTDSAPRRRRRRLRR